MKEQNKEKLLRLIDDNAKLTNEQLAVMLGEDEQDVAQTIADFEKLGVIRGYKALIDWDQTDRNLVSARIEIKVIPKGTMGFEEIAYTISQFREVETCYLMSGGYDLALTISGKTFKDIALFVAHRLAPLEPVQSTSTHFVLKKYKQRGQMMVDDFKDEREVTSL
ncbi:MULTISPECIES: Lrp/AsnC family transcriptional regulator [Anaerotruncus]|jgi:DNA-binding Lrp family transcriptional regulator|uniref:Lrp/AsnC family transcriptional regulator n=1 Tax=Anaerotruncus colihominis TaxID=169435 RepID=A0A845T003_9FIRM|nr:MULTISPECIES: Lrp/AsnC family transcriptional regulator [Anaerotruncus]MCI8491462.1 Lrp/AsnC family transcriptional regulator [Anaerotruncus sp.]MCR2024460.1 Lrp/AsnC family transcriptional regulator [Anaerotruncus colihominis]NBI79417.1 Lrp/AsnC family transcriptional regulator [Anaerotruncus colihominis]NDO39822.1 Lrp/AsnC family transcriptional regulator [Anaerotruncus colihominis]